MINQLLLAGFLRVLMACTLSNDLQSVFDDCEIGTLKDRLQVNVDQSQFSRDH
jgi:hypothetical protein